MQQLQDSVPAGRLPTSAARPGRPVVIFSPLPPEQNGIADYTHELLAALGARRDIICVIDDRARKPLDTEGARILHYSEYLAAFDSLRGLLHVYHVGNNPWHAWLLPNLLLVPGVVVLHDLTLNYLIQCSIHSSVEAFGDRYGALVTRVFGRAGLALVNEMHRFSCIEDIVTRSLHVVVHSRHAKQVVAGLVGHRNVSVVPHYASQRSASLPYTARAEVRRKLGIPVDARVVVSAGFGTHAKQIAEVANAVEVLRRDDPRVVYIVAGSLEAALRGEVVRRNRPWLKVTGYLPEQAFSEYIVAADVLANLRHPYGGESSGPLSRALSIGRCALVSDIGAFAELPADVVTKVPARRQVADDIVAALRELFADDDARVMREFAARDYARAHLSISAVADRYMDIFAAAGQLHCEPPSTVFASALGVSVTISGAVPQVVRALAAEADDVVARRAWTIGSTFRRDIRRQVVLVGVDDALRAALARCGIQAGAGLSLDAAVAFAGEHRRCEFLVMLQGMPLSVRASLAQLLPLLRHQGHTLQVYVDNTGSEEPWVDGVVYDGWLRRVASAAGLSVDSLLPADNGPRVDRYALLPGQMLAWCCVTREAYVAATC